MLLTMLFQYFHNKSWLNQMCGKKETKQNKRLSLALHYYYLTSD